MKSFNLSNNPDVIMIYQDRDTVEPAIQQIMELELKFKAYKYNIKKLHAITEMKPKVLLLSSNSVKSTIQVYIDYLEEYEQKIAPHRVILLINNRENLQAYLSCENGLFDNYVIINPLNEPYRLKLSLLQELNIIENHKNNSLELLVAEGEDQLASCIEHGVALKKSFIQEVTQCEEKILLATNDTLENMEASKVLHDLIGLSFDEVNESISADIQKIIDQLSELKLNNQLIKQGIEKQQSLKNKTMAEVKTEILISAENDKNHPDSSRYKVLIAEPSDMFARVIEEIFSETVFEYLLVNDGQIALSQITQFKPDVVFLAYDLPKINGFEITKVIRGEGNNVPIIAYTHPRDKEAIKEWVTLGLSESLIKPSKKSIILKSIDQAVKKPIEVIEHNKTSDNTEIKWDVKYSVGNKDMDEQHKALFTMINDFIQQSNSKEAIIMFDSLLSYIELHFEAEENLLKQINYPSTDEHIAEHEELREKFNVLKTRLDDYNVDIQKKIALFLYNWLAKHILSSDMEYKSYALSIGEESFIQ
jgi:hemerythrin-like metal-binding protein